MYRSVEEFRSSLHWVFDSLRKSSSILGGASLWRALYTTFTVSNYISFSIVSQPSCCISGSDGASKQLFVATLAALFCNFSKGDIVAHIVACLYLWRFFWL